MDGDLVMLCKGGDPGRNQYFEESWSQKRWDLCNWAMPKRVGLPRSTVAC